MRKTKPKIISFWLFSFIVMLLAGCGSRKTDTQKNEKQQQKSETKIEYRDVVKEVVRTVRDTVLLERKSESKQEIQQQKQRQKTSKKRQYYENGTLKSEMEESSTETELVHQLTSENKHLRLSVETLKKEKEKLEIKEANYQSEIHSLKEKNKAKKTEREAYPWYYWVIGSIVLWEVLKIIVKYIIK